jgi:alkylhydroperoxidase/carboxymuconolactone decarboxylase family protein YurZ
VAAGATPAEIDQVLALAASTIGFPAAVAAFSWVRDCLAQAKPPPG